MNGRKDLIEYQRSVQNVDPPTGIDLGKKNIYKVNEKIHIVYVLVS